MHCYFNKTNAIIALPCSASSAAASTPSADWAVLSAVACWGWTPTGLNIPGPGMAEAMKLPGIVVVGGIIVPKGDSFTASWLVATGGCTRAGSRHRTKQK